MLVELIGEGVVEVLDALLQPLVDLVLLFLSCSYHFFEVEDVLLEDGIG